MPPEPIDAINEVIIMIIVTLKGLFLPLGREFCEKIILAYCLSLSRVNQKESQPADNQPLQVTNY
jgi:hypothetical protein